MSRLLLILSAVFFAAFAKAGPIAITEQEEGFLFTEGSEKVLFYQRAPKSLDGKYTRANYVHPLYDLDGTVITEDFPEDHRHHRGIFWTWHQLWVGEKRIGDPWVAKDAVWDVYAAEVLENTLKVRVHWKSPLWLDAAGKQKPIVEETTVIRVHPAEGDLREIDFEISLLAMEENVRIGGSEDAKGYSGFSPRFLLPADVRFRGASGPVTPKGTAVDPSPFMDLVATYANGKPSGVAMLIHPSTPGFPQPWILRSARSMQNPVYPGRDAVALSSTAPTVLRYRLVIHRREPDVETLTRWQADYASASSTAR